MIAVEKKSFMFMDEWFTLELEITSLDKREWKITVIHVLSGKTYEILITPSMNMVDSPRLAKIPTSLFVHVMVKLVNIITEEVEINKRR